MGLLTKLKGWWKRVGEKTEEELRIDKLQAEARKKYVILPKVVMTLIALLLVCLAVLAVIPHCILPAQAAEPSGLEQVHVKALVRTQVVYDAATRVSQGLHAAYITKYDEPLEYYLMWKPDENINVIGVWIYVETDYGRKYDDWKGVDIEWTQGITSLDADVSTNYRMSTDASIARCITNDWYDGTNLIGNHSNQILMMFPPGYGKPIGPDRTYKYLFVNVVAITESMVDAYFYATVKIFVIYVKR